MVSFFEEELVDYLGLKDYHWLCVKSLFVLWVWESYWVYWKLILWIYVGKVCWVLINIIIIHIIDSGYFGLGGRKHGVGWTILNMVVLSGYFVVLIMQMHLYWPQITKKKLMLELLLLHNNWYHSFHYGCSSRGGIMKGTKGALVVLKV